MVSINHIPEGTCFACVACESNGVLRTIRWYSANAFLPLPMDPYGWDWSYRDPQKLQSSHGASGL